MQTNGVKVYFYLHYQIRCLPSCLSARLGTASPLRSTLYFAFHLFFWFSLHRSKVMDFISLRIKVCYFAKCFMIFFCIPHCYHGSQTYRIATGQQLVQSQDCHYMNTYLSYQWAELGSCTHKLKTSFSGGHFAIGSIKPLSGSSVLLCESAQSGEER